MPESTRFLVSVVINCPIVTMNGCLIVALHLEGSNMWLLGAREEPIQEIQVVSCRRQCHTIIQAQLGNFRLL